MAKAPRRPPHYLLSVFNGTTEEKGVIGYAWREDNGSITIRINDFTTPPFGKEWMWKLFEVESPRTIVEAGKEILF